MSGYRYNFVDHNGAIQTTLVLSFSSDDTACEVASDILSHSNFARVEVLLGEDMIFQATRDDRGRVRPDGDATPHSHAGGQ